MDKTFFQKALPVFPQGYERTLNASFYFVLDLSLQKGMVLHLSGVSDYQVFLNGRLLHYGPARSAFQKHQVDVIPLEGEGLCRLAIELSSYQCLSFTRVKEDGFLCAEIFDAEGNSLYTTSSFRCYLNSTRLRKVIRFSYQREFSESYRLDEETWKSIFLPGGKVALKEVEAKPIVTYDEYWERITHYPTLKEKEALLIEGGDFILDPNAKIYDDRYIHSYFLDIFSPEEWEIDSNKVASQLKAVSTKTPKKDLLPGEYATFALNVCKTGFLHFDFSVKSEKALIYVLFDEIDTNASGRGPIGVLFYRNTTHNCLTYELGKGDYSLDSFEPYTAKYIRVFVLEGEAEVRGASIRLFENPDGDRLKFDFEDSSLSKIMEAGVNTFVQNATDILMDCPSRERAGWLCDTFFSGPAENLITGENLAERAFLRNYAHYVNRGDQPKGMLPMCYPCDFGDKGFIVNWPMFYILEIANYLDRHDDATLLEEAKEGLFLFLAYCKRFENEFGLLEFEDIHLFVEWSHANDYESLRGVNHPTNMVYASCLEKAGLLYGKPELIKHANSIRKKVRELSFDGTFFEDNSIRDEEGKLVRSGRICETTQYYAFAFGLADKKSHPSLYSLVKEKLGPKRDVEKTLPNVYPSNMFIGDYLRLYSFTKMGDYALVEKEIREYAETMVEKTGTIWEFDSTYASLTHCFASYVVNLLTECLTGISLISEKEKAVYLTSFKPVCKGAFKIKIPTVGGYISASCDEGGKLSYSLPDGYSLKRR